jgi:NF-kappa-B inhibitor-interacting Ras-like protein
VIQYSGEHVLIVYILQYISHCWFQIAVAVLGNRKSSHSAKGPAVDSGQAAHWAARERVRLYEVDAMNRTTLGEPFVHLASKLNPPPPRSTFPQLGMTRKPKDSG